MDCFKRAGDATKIAIKYQCGAFVLFDWPELTTQACHFTRARKFRFSSENAASIGFDAGRAARTWAYEFFGKIKKKIDELFN